MKNIICSIFVSVLGFSGIVYTITTNVKDDISPPSLPPSLPPSFPPFFPPLTPQPLIPLEPCYSCLGNPCRSCYNPSVTGRYEYTKYCCSYCGGCRT